MEIIKTPTQVVVKTQWANKCKKLTVVPNTEQTLNAECLVLLLAIIRQRGTTEDFWTEVWRDQNYKHFLWAYKTHHTETWYEYAETSITHI